MSLEEEVLSIISEYVEPIEKAVEKLTPKMFDTGFLVKEFGEPVYRYSAESFSEGLAKPFWELFSRGGKRWRPALAVIAYEALGGRDPGIYTLAAVPEIIHNATLIVDDVEDGSLMRRGAPCIHRIYGIDIAINAGNAYYYIPVYIAAKKLPKNMATLFLEKYLETMTKLSLGQTMDIVWHRGLVADITEEHYLQMATFKTGALSRFAVELAAIYAERQNLLEELGLFGEVVGTAFQIQDDYLNIFGDEAKYGKEIGGDITEGKYTLMTVYAMAHLPAEKASRLRQILQKHTSDKQELEEAIKLIRESGADKYAREVMRRSVQEAWNRVEPLLPETPSKTKLKKLATFLIERTL